MTTRLGHQTPDPGIKSGIATMPNCRYLFYLTNPKLEKSTLRLNYLVFPYSNYLVFPCSSESSEWHLKEDGKPDEAFLKAMGVRAVRAAVLLCGGLPSPMSGTELACVEKCVLSAGEIPVVRGTALSLMLWRRPGQGGTQSCTQHRTAVLGHCEFVSKQRHTERSRC